MDDTEPMPDTADAAAQTDAAADRDASAVPSQGPGDAVDPQALALAVAIESADEPDQVGAFDRAIELDDHVTDFRFACTMRGYEGWQWSVTLYHDEERGLWTVDESSLAPTDDALRPPTWIPWKDRLRPDDLSPTDSIGTEADDPRLEEGFRPTEPAGKTGKDGDASDGSAAGDAADAAPEGTPETDGTAESPAPSDAQETVDGRRTEQDGQPEEAEQAEEAEEIAEDYRLTRHRVLSPLGRAQAAQRWYEGPRGPKAMSTRTAGGHVCSTCGFFVPLKGDLDRMFGVCANRWSPDDGRVVSIDHGCGEHSEIEPPEPSHLWVQSKPAFDDLHIDIIAQSPREERGQVELLEEIVSEAKRAGDDGNADEATEKDIEDNTAVDDEEGAEEDEERTSPDVEATVDLDAPDTDADADADTETDAESETDADVDADGTPDGEGAEAGDSGE